MKSHHTSRSGRDLKRSQLRAARRAGRRAKSAEPAEPKAATLAATSDNSQGRATPPDRPPGGRRMPPGCCAEAVA